MLWRSVLDFGPNSQRSQKASAKLRVYSGRLHVLFADGEPLKIVV